MQNKLFTEQIIRFSRILFVYRNFNIAFCRDECRFFAAREPSYLNLVQKFLLSLNVSQIREYRETMASLSRHRVFDETPRVNPKN
jgi:hypothetical protein